METQNEILALSIDFTKTVINYTDLLESRKKYIIANPLLQSGTSVGANVFEAQSSEINIGFIDKIKIADKEAYRLILCKGNASYSVGNSLSVKLLSNRKVLSIIVSTAQKHHPIN